MKNRIKSINQFLLERYPIVWNTRILWVLSAALIIHLFFFLFGVMTLTNPSSLLEYDVLASYFRNGMLLLGLVISLILLVLWLVTLFRNNAFKNFYPTSAWDLLKQFCAYVLIIFVSTSFYYSYTLGLQTYIKIEYPQERIAAQHRVANDSGMFRSESVYNYTLDERIIPKKLDTLYCETRADRIDTLQPHVAFKDALYQFYSFRKVVVPLNQKGQAARASYNVTNQTIKQRATIKAYNDFQQDSLESTSLRRIVNDSTITYLFKDKVVDVSDIIKDATPSYYNYANLFYEKDGDYDYYNTESYAVSTSIDYYSDDTSNLGRVSPSDAALVAQVKRNHALLDKRDPEAIKEVLKKQLQLLDYYGIEHNVTVASWFKLVYHPAAFPLKNTIANNKDAIYQNEFIEDGATAFVKYAHGLKAKRYIEGHRLKQVFINLDDVHDTNIFEGSVHFFIWISFVLALLIFIFRTTGLRELLFSAVAFGVLAIVVGLLCVLISYGSNYSGTSSRFEEYIFTYVPFIAGFIIFSITFLAFKRLRKPVSAILLNITFVSLLPWLFLILGIISIHQNHVCRAHVDYFEAGFECMTILEQLGVLWSYIFAALGFLWVYVYAHLIVKWRSLPEK